jgi:hypothetical protein
MTLRDRVFEVLDNVLKDGYDLRKEDAALVAITLQSCDVVLENVLCEDMFRHVVAWQEARRP